MTGCAERRAAALEHAPYQAIVGSAYTLLGCLGSGGMGIVFEASHAASGTKVAIKFPVASGDDRRRFRLRERFLRETRAMARLQSDCIVRTLDFGVGRGGSPYLVMERLEGCPLSHLLERGPLPLDRALPLIRDICRGVSTAHAAGIVHRDLKPSNLFVIREAGQERCKVLDFGLATRPGAPQAGLLGTVPYMAPEQLSGRGPVDARSDVFALGLVFFEMLSGESAYPTGARRASSSAIAERLPDLATAPGLPASLEQIVSRALEPDRCRRLPTAAALLEALERDNTARGGRPSAKGFEVEPWRVPGLETPPAATEAETDPSGNWPWGHRSIPVPRT